jgi:hypothetical protein
MGSPSAREAARQAEIVAAASKGCWSKGRGALRVAPKLCDPMGLKVPTDEV